MRLKEFIPGLLLEYCDISDKVSSNLGTALARFDQAIVGFDHPAAHRAHPWDLTPASQHEHKISLLQDAAKVQLLSWAFVQYKNINAGNLKQINWQFVHGDTNPENILIS